MNVFFMKSLLPEGEGAFLVHRFAKDTEEGAASLRDVLLAAGDWSDAEEGEFDAFISCAPAIAEVLRAERAANSLPDEDASASSDVESSEEAI
jgi:hypothetical protein